MSWCLRDLTVESTKLYRQMFSVGATEPQARAFWEEILDTLISTSEKALRRRTEQPPVTSALSEHRRRRVDIHLDSFVEESKKRITLMYIEIKRADATRADFQTVEIQAQDACEAYLNSPESVTSEVYAMCVLGPLCRMFRYIKDSDFDWEPLWGNNEEYDRTQYIDVAEERSKEIWNTLNAIVRSHSAGLANKEYL